MKKKTNEEKEKKSELIGLTLQTRLTHKPGIRVMKV